MWQPCPYSLSQSLILFSWMEKIDWASHQSKANLLVLFCFCFLRSPVCHPSQAAGSRQPVSSLLNHFAPPDRICARSRAQLTHISNLCKTRCQNWWRVWWPPWLPSAWALPLILVTLTTFVTTFTNCLIGRISICHNRINTATVLLGTGFSIGSH